MKQWSFTQPLINTFTNTLLTTCGQTLGHNPMQVNIVGFQPLTVHTKKIWEKLRFCLYCGEPSMLHKNVQTKKHISFEA